VFVVDCSVTMAWAFQDESTEQTDAVLDRLVGEEAVVPSIWPLEVVNVLVAAERRKRLSRAMVTRFVEVLGSLPIVVDEDGQQRAFSSVLPLAREAHLSSYDAAYLELAMRLGVPLATTDAELRRAASEVGVALLGL
jgi:predicted nucleic acid-binding protein